MAGAPKFAICLLCALGLVPSGVRTDPPDPGLRERARGRVHSLRLRIEPTYKAEPGICLQMGVDDLKVRLRGKPIEDPALIRLHRDPEPSVHALLLDASGSMSGRLSLAREAAIQYVRQLRTGHERALVLSFDESVQMHQAPSRDVLQLSRAIEEISMGLMTSMHDALVLALRELESYSARPVVVLLTDGGDSDSVHEQGDVYALVDSMPELTVFTIGLSVAPIRIDGSSHKTFLQRLAGRTRGRYFDAPTSSRLPRIYQRIREMLDSEATLSVLDPDPDAEPGEVRVASRRPGCRVTLLHRKENDPVRTGSSASSEGSDTEGTQPLLLTAQSAPDLFAPHYHVKRHPIDPLCVENARLAGVPADGADAPSWFLRIGERSISGCVLDVTMDYGLLFDPFGDQWVMRNDWLWLKRRAIEFSLPAFDELPTDLVSWMDGLARTSRNDAEIRKEMDPRQRPVAAHARPFHGHPALVQGRTFFELRDGLARALFARPDYREWTERRLRLEARKGLERLEVRFRGRVQGRTAAEIADAARRSPEGRKILERAEHPRTVDLRRFLAGWLGDVSAHDLFADWEMMRINRRLGPGRSNQEAGPFLEEWAGLRTLFHVPSHTRVITPLAPILDPARQTVGYWRIVLPRAGLLMRRVKGYRRPAERANTPLDLIPDVPLAYWLISRLTDGDAELARTLSSGRFQLVEIEYELLGKSGTHRPRRAFGATRLTLEFAGSGSSRLALEADVLLEATDRRRYSRRVPRLEGLQITECDDQQLEARLRHAAALEVLHGAVSRDRMESR